MKRSFWILTFFFFVATVGAGELRPPVFIEPLPSEYGDEFRKFQGISSLAVTSDQDVWVTWYTGGVTEDQDNYVVVSRSRDGGKTWSKPLFCLDQPGEPRQYDPSIWFAPDGRLYLFWAQRPGHDGPADLWSIATADPEADKPTWSAPRFVTEGVMMNKPIVDSNGRWILPVSVWNLPWAGAPNLDRSPNGPAGAWFVTSEDQGATWTRLGRGFTPPERALFDEHSIVEMKDGRFWIMNRTNRGIGDFYSEDGGKTWTDFKESAIKHTSSRFFLRRLQSGNLILVKNGPIDQDVGRSQMTAFLSKDDGKSWEGGLLIDSRRDVSYPDGDQAPDGTIYLTYDYSRTGAMEIYAARITEEDILAGKLVSSGSRLRVLVNKASGRSLASGRKPPVALNQNEDGKPCVAEPRGVLKPLGLKDEVRPVETGQLIFGNRDYVFNQIPENLKGRDFIFSPIDETAAVCEEAGWVWAVSPMLARNHDSAVETLEKAGFEKVATPEFILFGCSGKDAVALFQKKMEKGESIRLPKWGVLIF